MAIPIHYNIRNLRVRRNATLMTAFGIALSIAAAMFIMSLLAGLKTVFAETGDPLHVLVLRKGSTSEMGAGGIPRDVLPIISALPGVASNSAGRPLASGEDILVIVLSRKDGSGDANITVRFLTPLGIEIRPKVKLVKGRWFNPGQREVTVSKSIHGRFEHTNIGDKVWIGKSDWTVVGVFDSNGAAHESEIWADINQLASDFDRKTYASVLVKATNMSTADSIKQRVASDQRIQLTGLAEPDYFARQSKSSAPIQFIGLLVSITMAVGSCFAAMNIMYSAVANRGREIATLRVLGFSRFQILLSFLLESLLLSVVGALIGIVLMLPFNGMTTGTANAITFTETVFQVRLTPFIIAVAIAIALIIGAIGGLAPAWQASRKDVSTALRE
jgi:putative ABC transport system permease protein